jgi:hypothetical protein
VTATTEGQGLGDAAARERQKRGAASSDRSPAPRYTDNDASGEGQWVGWRDWSPPGGSFTIRFPARPTVERDEVFLGGRVQATFPRLNYRARDAFGWDYWISVVEYPADVVRFEASRIRSEFASSALFPYSRNDHVIQKGGQLAGREVQVRYGTRSQLVNLLWGNRYYELLVAAKPGDNVDLPAAARVCPGLPALSMLPL